MFAEIVGCPLIVLTGTTAIAYHLLCRAVGLAGNLRGAIRQQLHIARQHQCYRLVDPLVALWQLGLVGDPRHCGTPGSPCTVVAVVHEGVAFQS